MTPGAAPDNTTRPDERIDRLQSVVRSFIYGQFGHAGRERTHRALDALEELENLARRAVVADDVNTGA